MNKISRLHQKGITLIEVMIVLGIVIVLAGVLFAVTSESRKKAQDAKTKQTLSTIRSTVEEDKGENSTYATVCSSGKSQAMISELAAQQGLDSNEYNCVADDSKYVVLFPLQSQSGYWCVDAKGNSGRVTNSTSSSQAKECTEIMEEEAEENDLPQVDAGENQTIFTPKTEVTLTGSATDSDGSIVNQQWTKISGGNAIITSPGSLTTEVTGLEEGEYVFQLAATDNDEGVGADTVTVTVVEPVPPARTLTVRGPIPNNINQMYFYESLPRGYSTNPNRDWPVLIFLHGAYENTPKPISVLLENTLLKYVAAGEQFEYEINGITDSMIILAPQYDWFPPQVVDAMVEYAKANYNVDVNRIALSGVSSGSAWALAYPAESNSYAQKISAVAVSDGQYAEIENQSTYCRINQEDVSFSLYYTPFGHNPAWMTEMYDILTNRCLPYTPTPNSKITSCTNSQCDAWDMAFDEVFKPRNNFTSPNIYEWVMMQRR